MASLPNTLMPHRVSVQTYLGDAGQIDSYALARYGIRCMQSGSVELTADGELIAPVTLRVALRDAPFFTNDSLVTLHDGQTKAYVQAVALHDDGGLGAWQHAQIVCR